MIRFFKRTFMKSGNKPKTERELDPVPAKVVDCVEVKSFKRARATHRMTDRVPSEPAGSVTMNFHKPTANRLRTGETNQTGNPLLQKISRRLKEDDDPYKQPPSTSRPKSSKSRTVLRRSSSSESSSDASRSRSATRHKYAVSQKKVGSARCNVIL